MQEKILDCLKKRHEYVSGDALSHRLGISRQALWKHIQELKELGYEILAVPHLGYRLESVPDRLFDFEVRYNLGTQIIGRKIYYFDSVTSTMNVACQLAIKNAGEGTVVLAESQTKGKGRLGRNWFSPKYKGIYMSLILRPKIMPNEASILTLLSAVSVCEAIKESSSQDTQIKWPNDILLLKKKVGGVLTELNAEMDQVNFVIIGIGLNVNNDKSSLVPGATSLKEHIKGNVSRIILLQEVLRKIESNYLIFQRKKSSPIIEKWRQYNLTLNTRVKVYCHQKHIEGEAKDIDLDGGLLIRRDSGVIEKVMAGDVVHCKL